MKTRDVLDLLLLAALWGGSFLFMRLGAHEFGPVALAAVRVTGASLLLLPLLAWRQGVGDLRQHWRPILVVGLTNSALPFMCFSYAALSITAGLASIFNATTPLFGALIAWLWLRDQLTPQRMLGLAVGFAGVLWLAWDKASFKPGGTGWAIVACLFATLLYGFAASFTKKRLTGVPPLALATGSQMAAVALLVPLSLAFLPPALPSARAWLAAAALAVLCTAVAYILFFRLIARVGAARAIAVTYLIPVFAVLWGALFLHEALTPVMVLGCGVILLGTALTTGMLSFGRGLPAPQVPAAK
jgi:drug/metabolite transporter (DMT)-like permease